MGFSMFWLAVKGKSPAVVRVELKLRATGEREEVPEAPVTGLELRGGWYVVVNNRSVDLAKPRVLARLSKGAEVVACFVEEHVMASDASLWANGKRVWNISHQAERGIMNLDADGHLPACFEEIRTANTTHQTNDVDGDVDGDVDYMFDVPLEVAQTLCGFRHDVDPAVEGDGKPFEVLELDHDASMPVGSPKRGFWSRLFG